MTRADGLPGGKGEKARYRRTIARLRAELAAYREAEAWLRTHHDPRRNIIRCGASGFALEVWDEDGEDDATYIAETIVEAVSRARAAGGGE